MREDASYPLVVRNIVPRVYQAFVLLWVGVLMLVTRAAWASAPPGAKHLWPWILLLFWAVGLFALHWAFGIECARLTIEGSRRARLVYGPPFRRRSIELSQMMLRIEDAKDSEGDPYFRLFTSVDERKIIISEGHNRKRLEQLRSRISDAMEGSRLYA